jgi:DNA helicase HerA-like ATPase
MRGTMDQIHIVASHIVEKLYAKRRSFIDAREYTDVDAEPFPPFFIGMDEAHLFCPNNTSFSLTKRIMKTIAQEGRKYGVFEIFATQRPSLLDETIVAQIANKFIFRLSIKEDIDSIKKETDLNEGELKKLPYMNSGECYVSSSIIGRTIFAKIRYGITTSKNSKNPFDEFESMSEISDVEQIILDSLPFNDFTKADVIKKIKDETGKVFSVPELNKTCDDLAAKGLMIVESTFMGKSFLKK